MHINKIVEKVFSYRGYQCYVVFLSAGWRCGYVSIPAAKNKKYNYDMLLCHGGITYSDSICPIPCVQASDFWWIGFDCAHYGDGMDLNACEKYYGHSHFALPMAGHIRTVEFCEKELKNIVDQLKEA